MDIVKLFNTLPGNYHDGALCDAIYKDGILHIQCFLNSPSANYTENFNYCYVIIRFDNITNLQVYDYNTKNYVPYTAEAFKKEDGAWAITGINYLDYEDGFVVFGECMRFSCENVALLENSNKEIDFNKYKLL